MYMQKFKCTYNEMMDEPYHIIQANMSILAIEAEEKRNAEKMSQLKNKLTR